MKNKFITTLFLLFVLALQTTYAYNDSTRVGFGLGVGSINYNLNSLNDQLVKSGFPAIDNAQVYVSGSLLLTEIGKSSFLDLAITNSRAETEQTSLFGKSKSIMTAMGFSVNGVFQVVNFGGLEVLPFLGIGFNTVKLDLTNGAKATSGGITVISGTNVEAENFISGNVGLNLMYGFDGWAFRKIKVGAKTGYNFQLNDLKWKNYGEELAAPTSEKILNNFYYGLQLNFEM